MVQEEGCARLTPGKGVGPGGRSSGKRGQWRGGPGGPRNPGERLLQRKGWPAGQLLLRQPFIVDGESVLSHVGGLFWFPVLCLTSRNVTRQCQALVNLFTLNRECEELPPWDLVIHTPTHPHSLPYSNTPPPCSYMCSHTLASP